MKTKPRDWEKLQKLKFIPNNCPVCRSDQIKDSYPKSIKGYELTFNRCASCNSIYPNPRIAQESLANLYSSKEFFEGEDEQINYFSYTEGIEYRLKTAQRRLKALTRHGSGGKILEVASAAGFFLKNAKEHGYDVQGLEISKPMATWSSREFHVPVINGSIETYPLEHGAYDYIACWGVFTIIQDLHATLKKINRALRIGGILGFNTYYSECLWSKIWRSHWYILVLNTSQIFSQKALLQILNETGFEIMEVKREWQYTDLKYLTFQMGNNLPFNFGKPLLNTIGKLPIPSFKIPLPDVKLFTARKVSDV